MLSRIAIKYKVKDARAETKKKQFQNLGLKGRVRNVSVVDSYVIDAKFSEKELKKVAKALSNPIIEESYVNQHPVKEKFSYSVEIGFLPGVTDNIAGTACETIEDLLKKKFKAGEAVYTSQIYFIQGTIILSDAQKIADSLYNPLIQSARVTSFRDFKKTRGLKLTAPKVSLKISNSGAISTINLNIPDEKLVKIGKKGILNKDGTRRGPLALDLDYMKAIQAYFKKLMRNPTDIELESIAQTWSEHCKHTIFADKLDEVDRGLYKTYIKEATNIIRKKKGKKDFCVSVFTDNSGGIVFDEKYLVTHKVETHNSPSALDPFGGAITGIGGVNRDAIGFGLGAKPIANVYGFCLADPNDKKPLYRDQEKTQKKLSARRIMDGIIAGINVGGNCSGIPTALGFLYFNPRYGGKPLVFAGTVGLIPRKIGNKFSHEKSAEAGDLIVMVGGRVGQDGIHGATFSSEGTDSGSPATAVQIGDPITQKKLSDAIVKEARDKNLYTSITDNGAGGLSCSVAEMAKECGGAVVELDKVPLKYPGLSPWQTWISESQERMTIAVPKSKWSRFKRLMDRRGVEATAIGVFSKNEKCIVKFKGKIIMDLDMAFLHNGLPKRKLRTKESKISNQERPKPLQKNFSKILLQMLARKNITSIEFVSRQYDHEVQGNSVLKPLQGRGQVNGDASIFRPILDSSKGVVISHALNPTYTELDPYKMASSSVDSAIRAAVSAGADIDHLAILDNFCWCSSNEPERLWQLKQAVKSCFDSAIAFETPFISGKDSMFNDFKGFDEKGNPIKISVPPTLLVSAIGVIPDATASVSIDPKMEGDLIYLLGQTNDELGGSEYYELRGERKKTIYNGGNVPSVEAVLNRKLYKNFYKAVRKNLIASAISVGRGGLGVALAKMSAAGKLGIIADIGKVAGSADSIEAKLFSESQGRIIVTIAPKNKKAFVSIFKGSKLALLGKVSGENVFIKKGNKKVASLSVDKALRSYKSAFKNF
ncbi:MAG TPA: phosphoribosylformylglycinamidine synthase subunit PurL [Candidatus Paceibacterota bacterium]